MQSVMHTEMTEAKTFRTFIRICSLYKNERLRANIKLTVHVSKKGQGEARHRR
jgi:hypothetical protein